MPMSTSAAVAIAQKHALLARARDACLAPLGALWWSVTDASLRVKEARDAAAAGQAALAFARIVSIQPPGEAGGS